LIIYNDKSVIIPRLISNIKIQGSTLQADVISRKLWLINGELAALLKVVDLVKIIKNSKFEKNQFNVDEEFFFSIFKLKKKIMFGKRCPPKVVDLVKINKNSKFEKNQFNVDEEFFFEFLNF
jgi:hypothetical protein